MSADDSDEKPTPPVPPMDTMEHPEKRKGTRVLESEPVDTCDCGGVIHEQRVATGRVILAFWDGEEWDPEEYQTSTEYEETEGRVRCDRCGAGYDY